MCECNEGYVGYGTVCGDFDECTAHTLDSGSFDLDECGHSDLNNCVGNAVCTNIHGSYHMSHMFV